jgi:hypothetical protein
MRLGVDQKNLSAQTRCPEVATELGKPQFGVICYWLRVIRLKEIKLRIRPIRLA